MRERKLEYGDCIGHGNLLKCFRRFVWRMWQRALHATLCPTEGDELHGDSDEPDVR